MNFIIDYNFKKNKKKQGFTLIEVIAALAIIAILTAVFVPKVSNYIQQSKEVKALDDVRQVVLAVEDYNISAKKDMITESFKFGDIKKKIKDLKSIDTIDDDMEYKTMKQLANGSKKFKLNNGKIEIV